MTVFDRDIEALEFAIKYLEREVEGVLDDSDIARKYFNLTNLHKRLVRLKNLATSK